MSERYTGQPVDRYWATAVAVSAQTPPDDHPGAQAIAGRLSRVDVAETGCVAVFWGTTLSAVGVWMHSIVAAIAVFDATGSALMVGQVAWRSARLSCC